MAFSSVTIVFIERQRHQEAPEWLLLYRQRGLDDEPLTCREWLRRYTVTKRPDGMYSAHARNNSTFSSRLDRDVPHS